MQQATSSPDSSSFWGAFAGAFLAFIFGLIAYRITKRWERFVEHKNALVKLERILNRHYNSIATLEQLTADTSRILASGKMTSNRFFNLNLPEGLDLELASVQLINKYFAYESYIERYNINAGHFNSALDRFEDLLIAGQPLHPANLDYSNKMLAGFKKDLAALGEETKKLLVLARLHLAKIKKLDTFPYGVLRRQWDFEITPEEIAKETEKLDGEIAAIQSGAQ